MNGAKLCRFNQIFSIFITRLKKAETRDGGAQSMTVMDSDDLAGKVTLLVTLHVPLPQDAHVMQICFS
jgi:hypothetical protein